MINPKEFSVSKHDRVHVAKHIRRTPCYHHAHVEKSKNKIRLSLGNEKWLDIHNTNHSHVLRKARIQRGHKKLRSTCRRWLVRAFISSQEFHMTSL